MMKYSLLAGARRVRHLLCPLFVMHGQRDDIIPFYHGYRLHKVWKRERRYEERRKEKQVVAKERKTLVSKRVATF